MGKIVRFLRDSRLMRIFIVVIGFLIVSWLLNEQNMFTIWLTCVWQMFVYIPIAYDLSAQFNFTFCSDFNSKLQKVKLNSLWQKVFCGVVDGYMVWPTLLYQCLLLIYILTSVCLCFIFIATALITSANQAIWGKIWLFEVIALDVILAGVLFTKTIYSIYISLKERGKYGSNISDFCDMIKNDKEMIKNKKIIKETGTIINFLKQYGLYFNNGQYYIKCSAEAKEIEEALLKKFPKLYVTFSANQSETICIEIYSEKKYLLLKIETINT